jgi:hypothetical protein
MEDKNIIHHIKNLVDEEENLLLKNSITDSERNRLHLIKTELDQYYDLLNQRRAQREFGGNPDSAKLRPKDIVENYRQ